MIKWQSIETAPLNKDILIYQKQQDAHNVKGFYEELMTIGKLYKTADKFCVYPESVGGYEWECDITKPTHWAERPEPPK